MGKSTRFFRQSKKTMSGNQGARNFSQIMRNPTWHVKIWNKVRGKGSDKFNG